MLSLVSTILYGMRPLWKRDGAARILQATRLSPNPVGAGEGVGEMGGEKFWPGHQFMRMPDAVPIDVVRQTLEQYIVLAGSAKELAKRWKISQQYLCDLRKGRRAFTDEILDNMSYQRIIVAKRPFYSRLT